jgi:Uncharacterized protein conserved in bacteria (DUF2147)
MKRLLAMAIVLLASSAAQAQYQFEYGGRTIRIDPDRGTVSIPGVYDNTPRKSKRAKTDAKTDTKTDQDSSHNKPASQDAKADQQPAPAAAPADTSAAPPPAPPPAPAPATAATTQDSPTATANNAPADTAVLPPPPPAPPAPAPLPPSQQDAAPPRAPAPPSPAVAAVPPPSQPAPAQRPRDLNSPVGVWLTEEKEGKVRIEPCGANLCGYSVDAKSNANGEQVLMAMKPGQGKWSGRILDPNTGSTYDSTIALKGPDTLRVQGCAFGGMFCGGQTWTRVN